MTQYLSNFFPFITWISKARSTWRSDIIAGATVAVILIPQSLAYAQMAGLPAYFGLYASFLPPILAALWGSSPFIATGPVVVLSLLTATAISDFATPQTSDFFILVAALAILVGIIQLSLGIFKLGKLIHFIAHPVILGFVNAAAIIIILTQFPKMFGFSINQNQHILEFLKHFIFQLPQTEAITFAIGFLSAITILLFKRYLPKFPGILVVVITATVYSYMSAYEGNIVGSIPTGLPNLTLPKTSLLTIRDLLTPALILALVGYMESVSIAKQLAAKAKTIIDPNQELIGQGLANISSGLSGSYPVSGSISRSAVNFSAGAKTAWASIVTGVIILLTLLFLTPFFYYLPQATLAAVIFTSVVKLIDFKTNITLWKIHRNDAIVAITTFMATFLFSPHLDYGILVGVGISLLVYAYRASYPPILIFRCNNTRFQELHNFRFRQYQSNRKAIAVSFDHSLIFTNAVYVQEKILQAVTHYPQTRYVLVLSQGINIIDATAQMMIDELIHQLKQKRISLIFAGIRPSTATLIFKTQLHKTIGKKHLFEKVNDALHYIHLIETKQESSWGDTHFLTVKQPVIAEP